MSASTVPLQRAWNSWDSEHPADMIHRPTGLRLSFCAFANSTNRFTRFASGSGVRLGPRTIDGGRIELGIEHAGTAMVLDYDKPDPFTLRGRWRVERFGGWGLRFWVMVVAQVDPAPGEAAAGDLVYDPSDAALRIRIGVNDVAIAGERPPLLVTFHDSIEALAREYETEGYFYLDSRGVRGRVAALRYNLDEMPRFGFAASLANDPALARRTVETALTAKTAAAVSRPIQSGPYAGSLDAVNDILGWNTVWDPVNQRPYTTPSRNWVARKFGGWGTWLNHSFYYAMMGGMLDPGLARENLQVGLSGATAEGNLPALMTGRDSWIDRSHPPLAAFLVWTLHLRTGARDVLAQSYPVLLRYHEWWWRKRDVHGDGLLAYGTSPLGNALYRGTKLGAKNESSMDNSPVHDEASFDPATNTLDCADVGLNSLIALDGEMVAHIARALGDVAAAERVTARAEQLKARIRTRLWDAKRKVFANRLWSGRFVRSLAPTSFYPLLCGAASDEQARAMARLLDDPARFGGDWLLPSVTRDDPAFAENVYWRGRIWPPLNFLVWHALKRNDLTAAASRLARNTHALFMREWAERRCAENFNATTGAALDQPDTDPFYGWGALMPYLGMAEVIDVNPWNGWEITHHRDDGTVGPVATPAGMAVVETSGAILTLRIDGQARLRTNAIGAIRHIALTDSSFRATMPATGSRGAWLDLPAVAAAKVVAARCDGKPLAVARGKSGVRLALPPSDAPQRIELYIAS